MSNANKCPRCQQFIFGTYCTNCKEDISEMSIDRFKDLFGKDNPFKDILGE